MAAMSDTTSQQLVVFSLGSEEYALPIGAVHEIIRFTEPRTVASEVAWIRGAVDESLAHSAEEEIREISLLQDHLHDDIARFVYERLKRRPMVLPVVVEV